MPVLIYSIIMLVGFFKLYFRNLQEVLWFLPKYDGAIKEKI